MTRNTFIEEMKRLEQAVLEMGDWVASHISEAVTMLCEHDFDGAHRLIAEDAWINQRRIELEMECMSLVARQQPMAGDLRLIATILAMVTELERIHDYLKGIARIALMIGNRPNLPPTAHLPEMARIATDMLRDSLTAFATRDAALARAIPARDDAVDALYNQIFSELIAAVVANPAVTDQMNYTQWAAHNLERTADRVSNICERIVYLVTGHLTELE